jgi:WD40 repeat protein
MISPAHDCLASALFSANGQSVLLITTNAGPGEASHPTATLWDYAEARPAAKRWSWFGPPIPLALSPAGDRLAAQADGGLKVWETRSGRLLLQLTQQVEHAAFDPSGQRLAAAFSDSVQVWQLATATPLWPAPCRHSTGSGPVTNVSTLSWSHNGRYLVSGARDDTFRAATAQVWDAANGRPVGSPLTHLDGILFADFSPRDDKVVTCGEDFDAIVWDARTGRQLAPPFRHKHQVWHAAFSQDGRWIATACRDGTARLWDAASGEPITPPFVHPDEVRVVQLPGAAEILFTRTKNGQTYAWNLPREKRSVADLMLMTGLLSAQQSGSTEIMMPQAKGALQRMWETLHSRYPEEFGLGGGR